MDTCDVSSKVAVAKKDWFSTWSLSVPFNMAGGITDTGELYSPYVSM